MPNFKERYKGTWDISVVKENRVYGYLKNRFSLVLKTGFGATDSGYIEGTAEENGFESGAPDFRVQRPNPQRDIVVEVSGPLRFMMETAPLWITKAKVEYAATHPEVDYFFAHVNGVDGIIRWIRVGEEFFRALPDFKERSLPIRGGFERFIEIPANHSLVQNELYV